MTYFITYMVVHKNGKYYVGRHVTENLNDSYLGSGKWPRSIKDKTLLKKTILGIHESYDDMITSEQKLLDAHIGNQLCMNFNNNSSGFACGDKNPAHYQEVAEEKRKRMLSNNPTKDPKVREKLSLSQSKPRGKWKNPMSEQGKNNISKARTGSTYSDEAKKKLSDSRIRDYADGTRKCAYGMLGKHHSDEAKTKMKSPKEIVACPHCSKQGGKAAMFRWHFDQCKKLLPEVK